MAEIRKHKPNPSAIAQALEAALGAAAKPVTPGAPPRPKGAATEPVTPSFGTASFAAGAAGGWTTINPGQVPVVPKNTEDDDLDDQPTSD